MWRTPQAAAWAELEWIRTVGRYVRVLVAGEKPKATTATLAEVRQMEDRLGLSPMAMLRLRWEVESAAEQGEGDQVVEGRWSELRVVDGD